MKSRHAVFAILAVLSSWPLLAGCKPSGTTVGGSGTGIGWMTGLGENLVPGIDSGNVQHEKAGNTDIVVVWIDKNQVSSSSSTTSGIGTKHSGKVFFKGGTSGPPDLEWQSDSNGSGSVTCGKTKFDLKDGRLILVSTTGSEPVVKQLKRDVSKLKATQEGVREYADSDEELREFFVNNAPPKAKLDLDPEKVAWIDLLKLADHKTDVVSGQWELDGGSLVSPNEPDAKIAFPVRPAGDYQLVVKFSRVKGTGGGPIICLPVGAQSVQFASMHPTKVSALEAIDGAYVDHPQNPTRFQGRLLEAEEVHTIDARVTMKDDHATIRVEMDGKRVADWTGNPNRFSLHPAWSLGDNSRLGLRAWEPFKFESAQLRMLSGEAKVLRAPK